MFALCAACSATSAQDAGGSDALDVSDAMDAMDARDSATRDDVVAEDRITVADVLDASDASEPADVADATADVADASDVRDAAPDVVMPCGNGVLDVGEECDNGASNGSAPDACRTDCRRARCGDAVRDTGEACDDGNAVEGDACDTNCTVPACGNGIRDPGELCFASMDVTTTTAPGSIAVGDFNRDGALDLAVGARSANLVSVLRGNGRGGFAMAQNVATMAVPVALVTADVNRDGMLDLLAAESTGALGTGYMQHFSGDGSGSLASTRVHAAGVGTTSIAADDVNGDGFVDAVVSNQNSNSLSLFVSTGTGYSTAATVRIGNPMDVAIADMNGDRRPDLVVAAFDDPITVFAGNGAGGFVLSTGMNTGPNPVALDLGDLDHDGDLDVFVANGGTANQTVLRNSGTAMLSLATSFNLGAVGSGVTIADFDVNGWVDVVYPRSASGDVAVLRNDGAGALRPMLHFATAAQPVDVRSGDFNADGLPDMAVACAGATVVRVLLSNP